MVLRRLLFHGSFKSSIDSPQRVLHIVRTKNPSGTVTLADPRAVIGQARLRVGTGISAELSPTGGFRKVNPALPEPTLDT
jgi:hypothetical protein